MEKNGGVHYKEHFLLVVHVSLTSSPLTHNFFSFSLFASLEVSPEKKFISFRGKIMV